MFSLISAIKRINKVRSALSFPWYSIECCDVKGNNPPHVAKKANPLRFGIISAARIAPDAIVKPAWYHEDVEVVAVAARSQERADVFAKQWNIAKSYGGSNAYQGLSLLPAAFRYNLTRFIDLLDDADVDAVYIGVSAAVFHALYLSPSTKKIRPQTATTLNGPSKRSTRESTFSARSLSLTMRKKPRRCLISLRKRIWSF